VGCSDSGRRILVCVATDKGTAPLASTVQTWELFIFRNLKMKYLFGCLMMFKDKTLYAVADKLHKYSATFTTTVGMLQQVADTKIAA
jgi:hypothetical protein